MSETDLRALQRDWDACGRADPLWAILLQTDGDLDAFFASGEEAVALMMRQAEELGLPSARRRALDFGCGAGRLTRALAARFDEAVGVDIAPSMIELAERHTPGSGCRFQLNERDDLAAFPDAHFDLICTLITLQHVPSRYAAGYLREFVRVLRPGGVAVFQLPSHPRRAAIRRRAAARRLAMRVLPERTVRAIYRRLTGHPGLVEMHGMPRERVAAAVESAGGRVLRALDDGAAGEGWVSYRYFVGRAG